MFLKNKAYLFDYFKYIVSIALIFIISSTGYAGISLCSIGLILFAFTGTSPFRAYISVFIIYLLVAGNPAFIVAKPFLLGLARYLSVAAIAYKSYSFFLAHPNRSYIVNRVKEKRQI